MYSIWIIPSAEIKQTLQKIINDLSKKYDAPVFEPHMTLIGNVQMNESEMIEQTKQLASLLKPFQLTLSEISFSTTYFQSVFVRIKANADLMNANLQGKELFKQDNSVFMPHMGYYSKK